MTHIHPPPLCPDCQQPNVAPILYGLPGEDMIDAAERGDIVLGGCIITGRDPGWLCRVCGRRFGGGTAKRPKGGGRRG